MSNVLTDSPLETRKPLREEVYNILRQAIADGRLEAGTRLVETEVAEQLGVSRTPVREAIRMLESEGLVGFIPRKGYVVCDFSAEEVEEIFGIRQVLEGYAGRLATVRISTAQLEQLQEIYERSVQCLEQNSATLLCQLNTEFHDLVIASSQNRRLIELIDSLRHALLSYRLATLNDPSERQRAVAGHKAILEALWRKDPAAVEELIKKHVAQSMDIILRKGFHK